MSRIGTTEYLQVLYIYWSEKENIFYDTQGIQIPNIFDMVTPNDIFLFRQDPGYCTFPYRHNNLILCEILTDE